MPSSQLIQLCQLYGINTSYLDMKGNLQEAGPEALLAVLKAMGAALEDLSGAAEALRLKHLQVWQNVCPPVFVIWEGAEPVVHLRLPAFRLGSSWPVSLHLESGELREWLWKIEPSQVLEQKTVEGSFYIVAACRLASPLPAGYHRLRLELPGTSLTSMVICAPRLAYSPPSAERRWGLFLPLYALHSRQSWGVANFGDLKKLMQWTAGLGGAVSGTLPLLAGFFDSRGGPGPYLPASKLFWNEFYLDIPSVPEFTADHEVAAIVNGPTTQAGFESWRNSSNVDYRAELTFKRSILEKMSRRFWEGNSPRWAEFQVFLANHPELTEYARFRAAGEKYGLDWQLWPAPREKSLPVEAELPAARYHMYVQWLATQQIAALNAASGSRLTSLYMDLPVGVHPFSYDVWKERSAFAPSISCGAPPDPVFTSGQNWDFPPLNPQSPGSAGLDYFIRCLRHQLKACRLLRIDHMMNFHRLFWIPRGFPNRAGVYVNYPAEWFYAVMTLESVRRQAVIAGEDLGLVPPEVRPMMDKHNIRRLFVGQFELIADNRLGLIPGPSVASLNTHDMFPFAAFWDESDISQRVHLKLIDEATARQELEKRRQVKRAVISVLQYKGLDDAFSQDTAATLRALLKLLAASPAETVLINLEDLWLETRPQNVPGTLRPQNWSHKAQYSLEQIIQNPLINSILAEIDQIRRSEPGPA
jgi:4-alpha-glucanotransferase